MADGHKGGAEAREFYPALERAALIFNYKIICENDKVHA